MTTCSYCDGSGYTERIDENTTVTVTGQPKGQITWVKGAADTMTVDEKVEILANAPLPGKEAVDHPQHYGGDTPYEVIKVIEAWGLGFHLGNAVKYIARAGKKDPATEGEDIDKAIWYLQRYLESEFARLKKENSEASVEKLKHYLKDGSLKWA